MITDILLLAILVNLGYIAVLLRRRPVEKAERAVVRSVERMDTRPAGHDNHWRVLRQVATGWQPCEWVRHGSDRWQDAYGKAGMALQAYDGHVEEGHQA